MVARLRLEEIKVDKTKAAAEAVRVSEPYIRKMGRAILGRSRALTPVRTGELRARQRVIFRITRTTVEAQIEARTSYAMYVHEGTKPHDIRPKRVSTLRWVTAGSMYGGGGIHFAKLVHHPGTRAQPFMRRALQEIAAPAGFRVGGPGSTGGREILDLSG